MLKAEIGDYYIRIPKEKGAIDKAKKILDFMASDLKEDTNDKKPKDNHRELNPLNKSGGKTKWQR